MGFEKYAILWLNHAEFLIINRIHYSLINVLFSEYFELIPHDINFQQM